MFLNKMWREVPVFDGLRMRPGCQLGTKAPSITGKWPSFGSLVKVSVGDGKQCLSMTVLLKTEYLYISECFKIPVTRYLQES